MQTLKTLKRRRPLVLNVTNLVSSEFIANGLLALGASPVMSHFIEEVDELVSIADTVVINIGTLNAPFMELAMQAAQAANAKNKPLILDPVGAGATSLRTRFAKALLSERRVSVVRGNASEILALVDDRSTTKGVDSLRSSDDALVAATQISRATNTVIIVSGERDLIVDHNGYEFVCGGSEIATRVVGMGCLLTAVVGALHAVDSEPKRAAVEACRLFKRCAEQVAHHAPGSFRTAFLDRLHWTVNHEN